MQDRNIFLAREELFQENCPLAVASANLPFALHYWCSKHAYHVHLSTDLLLQIFGFLDPRSLAISSAVCRIWNEAANDDGLWCTHFLSMFDGPNFERETMSLNLMVTSSKKSDPKPSIFGANGERHGFWRKALAWKLSRLGF
ncbi:unnamed protein product [Calypogeia fissa]